MRKLALVFIIIGLGLSAWARPAFAAPIEYGDFVGMNPGDHDFLMVKEDSITDPTPLFGAPIHQPNRLIFSPLTFASFAANGMADTTSGTLSMRIRADMGSFLDIITIQEIGDTTLAGLGNMATSSLINGLMILLVIDPVSGGAFTDALTVTPKSIFRLPGDEGFTEFEAVAEIDLTGLGIREVQLVFNNNLQTTSQPGTTSFIQKKTIIVHAPEPTTAALALCGSFLLLRRRRRFR